MKWNNIKLSILIFFSFVLCIQLPTTIYHNQQIILDFISIARIVQTVLGFLFIYLSFKKNSYDFLNIFLLFSILIQVINTIYFEPQTELVAYNFIAILIIISSICYRSTFKNWIKVYFPLFLCSLVLPIFFKTSVFYESLSFFIGHYLFGLFSLSISTIVVFLYSTQDFFMNKLKNELSLQEKKLKIDFENIQQQKIQIEIGNIASQVAHDIRSPLSALENITNNHLNQTSENFIAQESIRRIKLIAEDLLQKSRNKESSQLLDLLDVNELIKRTVALKQSEYPTFKLSTELSKDKLIANINELSFERILSNLINNSIEALLDKSKEVKIFTTFLNSKIIIEIKDEGKGIAPELLSSLGTQKISHEKQNGNGIGLFSAINQIKKWNGEIKIYSSLGIGTTVQIELPLFLVSSDSQNILIDNDELVRITWEARAKKAGKNLTTCSNSRELFNSLNNYSSDSYFYIDAELDNEKGEEVASLLYEKGYKNLIITTGHSSDRFSHIKYISKVIGKNPPF